MKYKGIELKEVTEPQTFENPKRMFVWDDDDESPVVYNVVAIVKNREYPVISEYSTWKHCAPIPEPKSKLVTNRELARWLAEGKGQFRRYTEAKIAISYDPSMDNEAVSETYFVRKWDDTEWHKPTREYLGLEDK